MKFHHLVSNTTPISLQNWLEEELESRGIDGVYTRYILSLLQHDSLEDPLNSIGCQHAETLNEHGRNIAPQLSHSKSRHRRWKSWDNEFPRLLVDHLKASKGEPVGGCDAHCLCSSPLCSDMECKKTVAVECLKSASEEKNGIEKLIDEVCTKLKNLKADCESPKCLSLPKDTGVLLRSLTLSEPFSSGKQMEMYYSAFPALDSKGISLVDANVELFESAPNLAELVKSSGDAWPHQHLEEIKGGTPEDSIENQLGYTFERSENLAAWDYGHVGGNETSVDKIGEAPVELIDQPTFIIPKMAAHNVPPSVTMFAPFTSSTRQRNIKVKGPEEIDQTNYGHSLDETKQQKHNDGVCLDEEDWEKVGNTFPGSGLSSPEDCQRNKKELLYLETDLASKFNSALAAIWASEETGGDPGLELSFKIYSMPLGISQADIVIVKSEEEEEEGVKEPLEDTSAKNINFFIGSAEDMSVWATKLEDVKALSSFENARMTVDVEEPASPGMSDLLHSLTSRRPEKDSIRFSSSWSDELDTVSDTECALILSNGNLATREPSVDDLLKEDYYQSEPSEEKPSGGFCLSPEMFFKETENDCLLSSTEDTEFEFDSLAEVPALASNDVCKAGAVYNLWNSPTPPPPLPSNLPSLLGIRGDSVWPASDPAEKVAEWIIKQFEEGPSSNLWVEGLCRNSSPNPWDNGGLIFSKESLSADPLISKENCTLTYHRGESCFVEVVPTIHPVENNTERTASRTSLISPNSICSQSGNQLDFSMLAKGNNLISRTQENEEEENLLTSHKTHFTPIRQESSETESSICDYEAVASALELSTTTYLKSKVKDGEVLNFEPKMASSTTLEEMLLLSAPLSLEDLERSKSPMESTEILNHVQSAWKLGLYKDKSTSTEPAPVEEAEMSCGRLETILEPTGSTYDEEDPLGFASFRKMRIWSSDSIENVELEIATEIPLPPHQIPWKWSTTDDTEENESAEALLWQHKRAASPDSSHENQLLAYLNNSRSGTPDIVTKTKSKECNLEALRREMEAEQEQLFRDIDVLGDDKEYCSAAVAGKEETETDDEPILAAVPKDHKAGLFNKEFSPRDFFLHRDDEKWSSEESEISVSLDNCSSQLNTAETTDGSVSEVENVLPLIPTEKILYSSQLEEEWHKSSQPFDIQVPRKSKSKSSFEGSSPQRRPCSFYLEGNCRRSDCKFSHDLSSITCRFWEEGSCFKGITCPFLHGYLSDEAFRQKYGSKIKFALESEADFPSLSNSSNQGTPLMASKDGKVAKKEAYPGRILRPKKKKLSSLGSKASSDNATSSTNPSASEKSNSTSPN